MSRVINSIQIMQDIDSLMTSVAFLFKCLLPVAGVVLIVYIILLVKQLISTLKVVEKTLDTTETQIKKLDAPLTTVAELSKTVDEVHQTTKDAAKNVTQSVVDGANIVKNWAQDKMNESKQEVSTNNE